MILAPIDGMEFSRACRRRNHSPALCRWSQLLRLLALMVLAGGFVVVALDPGRARAETATVSGQNDLSVPIR